MSVVKAWAVRIYLMQRGCDVWRWLCARCLRALEAEGWQQRQAKDPPDVLACDGDACRAARGAAVGVAA